MATKYLLVGKQNKKHTSNSCRVTQPARRHWTEKFIDCWRISTMCRIIFYIYKLTLICVWTVLGVLSSKAYDNNNRCCCSCLEIIVQCLLRKQLHKQIESINSWFILLSVCIIFKLINKQTMVRWDWWVIRSIYLLPT
jgi:hypothetical protein